MLQGLRKCTASCLGAGPSSSLSWIPLCEPINEPISQFLAMLLHSNWWETDFILSKQIVWVFGLMKWNFLGKQFSGSFQHHVYVYMLVNSNYCLVFLFLDCEVKGGIDIAGRFNPSVFLSTIVEYQCCCWLCERQLQKDQFPSCKYYGLITEMLVKSFFIFEP